MSNIEQIRNNAKIITDNEAASLLPVRKIRSNKGNFGKVLVFAGSAEMPGAASLACSASYAAGAGLVCACVLENVAKVIHYWQKEVITRILPGKDGMYCKNSLQAVKNDINNASVIVLGPGIGRSPDVTEFVREIIDIVKVPLVLDADALNAVCGDLSILRKLKTPCVITPHPGEMSRLTGMTVQEILDDIFSVAVNFARENNVITLLKDANTVIAHLNGDVYINKSGCNALAKGGTGDVLTGMIAGFTAQSPLTSDTLFTASALSAYIHGRAGEAAAQELSNYSVTATDVLKYIPAVIKSICL